MRIDKLLPPAQPGKPWTVALEGGDTLRVSEGVVVSFALYGGMELEAEALTALRQAAAEAALKERAGRLLTARMLSAGQLAEKLTAKGATQEQAARVVAWVTARGCGARKTRDELYRRRVPRELWDEALEGAADPAGAIDAFLEKRWKGEKPDDPKEWKRASDALARRGFSWEEIREALGRFGAEMED